MAATRKFHVIPDGKKEDFDKLCVEMYDVAKKHACNTFHGFLLAYLPEPGRIVCVVAQS